MSPFLKQPYTDSKIASKPAFTTYAFTTPAFKTNGGTRLWILIVLALAVLGAGLYFFVLRDNSQPAPMVLTEKITVGEFVRDVTGTGTVEAKKLQLINFATAGTVAEILVIEGDTVTEGQVLARLDDSALKRELADKETSLESANAQLRQTLAKSNVDSLSLQGDIQGSSHTLAKAQQTLSDAQQALATGEALFSAGGMSKNEVDSYKNAVAQARRDIEQAQLTRQTVIARQASLGELQEANRIASSADVSRLETAITNLKKQVEDAELKAVFDGVISRIDFQVGDEVGAGKGLELVDNSELRITVKVNENRALELQEGQKATIIPDAANRFKLPAILTRVSPIAIRSGESAQVSSEFRFTEDADLKQIRAGFTVTAKIHVNTIDDAMLIPLEAISEDDDKNWLYKVVEGIEGDESTNTIKKINVELLDRNVSFAAISSDELKEGDNIVLTNLEALSDGDAVSVQPSRNSN